METTYLNHFRALIAPCGCVAGLDMSDEVPGFCRSIEEAREDIRDGFTETVVDEVQMRALSMKCPHTPEWGRHV
jgi:hypothetical protein